MEACLFCNIVAARIPATRVYDDADTLAFADIRPQAPTHLIVIPKSHIPRVVDVAESQERTMGHLIGVANELARRHGLAESGFRLVINCGPSGGQTVYHLHVHLLGGRAMHWPPG